MNHTAGYGVVYTPKALSNYVASLLLREYKTDHLFDSYATKLSVLDPACGEGALLQAFAHADNEFLHGTELELTGIDIEKKVIQNNNTFFPRPIYQFLCHDAILPIKSMPASDYWKKQGITPDFIIANPPWSSEKIYQKEDLYRAGYRFDTGQFDSYVLFMELSIAILKENGYAAFIIPDSIFSGENKGLRKYLSENMQIRVIARLGEKFFPGVFRSTTVIVLKKQLPNEISKTDCFKLTTNQKKAFFSGAKTLMQCHAETSHKVFQKRFLDNPGYIFDVDVQNTEEALLKKIEKNSIQWDKIFHFGRGVEISKTGNIVCCPFCRMAQGYSKQQSIAGMKRCALCGNTISINGTTIESIMANKCQGNYMKIYVGENLHRYSIDGYQYIRLDVPGINYKDSSCYVPPKILIRKTGLGINACIDYSSAYITQTVYFCSLINSNDNIPLRYYLGVLNSRVVYYYYLKKYGESEWKSHPYFTKDILFSLPIPEVTEKNKNICYKIAQQVSMIEKKYDRKIDLEIERSVMELYQLNSSEYAEIIREMNNLPDLNAINCMKVSEVV